MAKVKAALYVRVSREDQNLENQLPALEQIAATRGYDIVETYSEKISGVKKARPKFDQMLEDARRGKFKVLLVWAIDRLGRSMYTVINTVLELDKLGVAVISHQEPWTDSQVRDLLVPIFAWIAEQERKKLIERTYAGLDNARASGKTLGRPKADFNVDEVLRLRKQQLSYEEIGKRLKVNASTIYRRLNASDDVPSSAKGKAAQPRVRTRKVASA